MKDIIGNILDIENKANEIIESGKTEKIRMEEQMNRDIQKMREDINVMVAAKLEQLDAEERKESEESLARIKKAAEKKLAAMEEFYHANGDSWVDTVFKIIIGSEKSGS